MTANPLAKASPEIPMAESETKRYHYVIDAEHREHLQSLVGRTIRELGNDVTIEAVTARDDGRCDVVQRFDRVAQAKTSAPKSRDEYRVSNGQCGLIPPHLVGSRMWVDGCVREPGHKGMHFAACGDGEHQWPDAETAVPKSKPLCSKLDACVFPEGHKGQCVPLFREKPVVGPIETDSRWHRGFVSGLLTGGVIAAVLIVAFAVVA